MAYLYDYIKSVWAWNKVAGNPTCHKEATNLDLVNQYGYYISEQEELGLAKTWVEALDGLIDSYVTLCQLLPLLEMESLARRSIVESNLRDVTVIRMLALSTPTVTKDIFGALDTNQKQEWIVAKWEDLILDTKIFEHKNINIVLAFQKINSDNWSKFITKTDIHNMDATFAYYDSLGEPVTLNWVKHGAVSYGIFRDSNNKIRKPMSYMKRNALDLSHCFLQAKVTSEEAFL